MRRYSDAQLISAVTGSHSWRGVLRTLGLAGTSASSMRSVRAHAQRLGLDYSHFTGQRRWTEEQLEDAVASSTSWAQVVLALGLTGGSSLATVRGHAVRLGLDASHFSPTILANAALPYAPSLDNLRRAGSFLAAAWFQLCGHSVSWPLEPAPYDLLVSCEDGTERIQVKTTTMRRGGSWVARISTSGGQRGAYDPADIDQFFIIDGDLCYYLIPVGVVGGLVRIHLSAYQAYRLPDLPLGKVESRDASPH